MIPTPAILKPKLLWTRKQILSLAILHGINVFKFPDSKSPDPALNACKKDTVGAAQGGLVHIVFCEKGPKATRMIFTCIQQIAIDLSTMASASVLVIRWQTKRP